MDAATVRERAGELPGEPGVYQFLDREETILYIGKAVDLPDRVRSYADPRSERIRRMRSRATAIDFAVTETETQALLLEANLIKRHQPTYNVRLKDDKSYPLVQLTDHAVPRIEITRDPDEAATVYGPYTDKGRLDIIVKALRQLYGIRGCSDHKFLNRDRPCLDHDIGLCSAPCTDEITTERYRDGIESVKRFFEGERGVLAGPLRQAMEAASQNQQFERAANLRDRLNAVESFHGEGGEAIHARDERTMDVLGVAGRTVARLHSENGSLTERECRTLDGPDPEENGTNASAASVLSAFIPQYYTDRELPDVLLISERPTDREVMAWLEGVGVDVRVPGAGREATLIDLALKNARRGIGTDQREKAAVAALTDLLGIDSIERIEGFDVSHAQGKAVVGSNVVFEDGQPEKGSYRRKKLTERNDDYANMRELLDWRAARAIEGRDDRPAPDLLLIDGGRGQLEAAMAGCGEWDVPAIAIAKGDQRKSIVEGDRRKSISEEDDGDRIITPERTIESCDVQALRLLQHVRDESHRFAVQYHQTVRDDVSTVLDEVEGIGPKTRANLLGRFGSIENVRAASLTELRSVPGVGEKTATTLDRRL